MEKLDLRGYVVGDTRDLLRQLPEASIHCVVTSPPYFGARNYQVQGQLGLESSLGHYVANLCEVFNQVHRVLRSDGTLWVVLGDKYAASRPRRELVGERFKVKDRLLVPARVAIALVEAGWWLRSEIVWVKPAVRPESVRDRPTMAHETILLFSKSPSYYYDAFGSRSASEAALRDVWTIAPEPLRGIKHTAAFPSALVEQCLRLGTSLKGVCSSCGAPWERSVERPKFPRAGVVLSSTRDGGVTAQDGIERTGLSHYKYNEWLKANPPKLLGWAPTCACTPADLDRAVVLDPFVGSGTVGLVAEKLHLDWIGFDLNPDYAKDFEKRHAKNRNSDQHS